MFWATDAPTDTASCSAFFRSNCHEGSQANTSAMLMSWTLPANRSTATLLQPEVDLASFLLARGAYAWIGYSWVGCTGSSVPGSGHGAYVLPASTQVDYGSPQGFCTEASPGVFRREWSRATVSMDCGTMKPTITMK